MHFEELWVHCEKVHQEAIVRGTVPEILNELSMKLNFYKVIDQRKDLPPEEMRQFRIRAVGEILLVLTNLSMVENINVFDALNAAVQYRIAEDQSKKLPT